MRSQYAHDLRKLHPERAAGSLQRRKHGWGLDDHDLPAWRDNERAVSLFNVDVVNLQGERGPSRWQAVEKPGRELEDERGVYRVDCAISVHVGVQLAGEGTQKAGVKLQDEGRVDTVHAAVAVGVAH